MVDFGSSTFGMEEVGNQTLVVIAQNINTQINILNAKYAAMDSQIASELGRTYVPVVMEQVPTDNIQLGEGKDVVEEVFDITNEFPRINIISSQARDTGQGGDHMAIYGVSLAIECWVKSSPTEGPEMVFKRATRMVEAVHSSILKFPNLNGLILNLDTSAQAIVSPIIRKDLHDPNVNLDTVFLNREDHHNGWYLCGGGVQYNIKKNSSLY